VFDSAKEQLIPIWNELMERVGMKVNKGESVETVARAPDGAFEIRTTVAIYRAQRVVLSIGTRGKPRTLQVPGENMPKVYNLLEDPDSLMTNMDVIGRVMTVYQDRENRAPEPSLGPDRDGLIAEAALA
jgi:thioredoxin reductase